MDKKDNLKNFL